MSEAIEKEVVENEAQEAVPQKPPLNMKQSSLDRATIATGEFRDEISTRSAEFEELESCLVEGLDDAERLKIEAGMSDLLGDVFDSIKDLAANSRDAVRHTLAHTLVFLRAVDKDDNFKTANFKGTDANKVWKKEALIQIFKLDDAQTRLTTYYKALDHIEKNWKAADGSLDDAKDVFDWIVLKKGIIAIYNKTTGGGGAGKKDRKNTHGYKEADDEFDARFWGKVNLPVDKDLPKIEEGSRVLLVGQLEAGQIEIKHIVEDAKEDIEEIMETLGDKLIAAKVLPDNNLFWRRVVALSSVVTAKDKIVAIDETGTRCTISNERSGNPSLVAEINTPTTPLFSQQAGRQRLENKPGESLKKLVSAAMVASHTVTYDSNNTEVKIKWTDEDGKADLVPLKHVPVDANNMLQQYQPKALNDWQDFVLDEAGIELLFKGLVEKWNTYAAAIKTGEKADSEELVKAKNAFKTDTAKTDRAETKITLSEGSDKMLVATPFLNTAGIEVKLNAAATTDILFYTKTADLKKIISFMKADRCGPAKLSFSENILKLVTDFWSLHVPFSDNRNYRTNAFEAKV